MPDDLKQRVQAEAQAEDRSVNSFIVRTLREAMDAKAASAVTAS
jgi:predicted HicB family RNase H-like nuclease